MSRRTARQVRDERCDAGEATLDETLGFPSTATFGGARGALRDQHGRRFRHREGDEWAFKLPPRRNAEGGVRAPEPGECVLIGARRYVVLEVRASPVEDYPRPQLHPRPSPRQVLTSPARRLTGLVALKIIE